MSSDRGHLPDEDHQVLRFRQRDGLARRILPTPGESSEATDLSKYEGGAAEDNYRHRMLVNIAALAFIVMLATAGIWLAVTIANMRKNQDCYLSGRRNCTTIEVQTIPAH